MLSSTALFSPLDLSFTLIVFKYPCSSINELLSLNTTVTPSYFSHFFSFRWLATLCIVSNIRGSASRHSQWVPSAVRCRWQLVRARSVQRWRQNYGGVWRSLVVSVLLIPYTDIKDRSLTLRVSERMSKHTVIYDISIEIGKYTDIAYRYDTQADSRH